MKKIFLGLLMLIPPALYSSSTATAHITYSVGNVDLIEMSSQTVTLITASNSIGDQPLTAINRDTTYSITTNGGTRKIYGSYTPLLQGPILSAELTPPQGAVSLGSVPLSDRPTPLVAQIANTSEKNLPVTYRLISTVATPPSTQHVTILYTVAP